jgi:hypothetical protein
MKVCNSIWYKPVFKMFSLINQSLNAPGDLEPSQVQPPVPLWGSADDALHGQAGQRQEVRQLSGQEQAFRVHARRRTGMRVQTMCVKEYTL